MRRITHIAILAFALVLAIDTAVAQKTLRPRLRVNPEQPVETVFADTLFLPSDSIVMSGFEKVQQSTKETLFITNRTSRTLTKVGISLDYRDMQGRQLHHRELQLPVDIPPGETRQIEFPSWDRQRIWHYHRTQGRHNAYSTPFDIIATLLWIL